MLSGADIFLDHFGLTPERANRDFADQLGQACSRLPYENLTKLIKKHTLPQGGQRRRLPAEVMADHVSYGAGGTCFALTELFGRVLARSGYRSYPVLCDTAHRCEGHSAVILLIEDEPHLIDPAYLIYEPRPLGRVDSYDLYSYGSWRYRIRLARLPRERFLTRWDASFDWPMMSNVHVCARSTSGEGYSYLHGHKLRQRNSQRKTTQNIRGNEAEALSAQFSLAPKLVRRAYQLIGSTRR